MSSAQGALSDPWSSSQVTSVIHDPHVTGDDLVLETGAGGDVYPVPVVGDDDDGALEADLEWWQWDSDMVRM